MLKPKTSSSLLAESPQLMAAKASLKQAKQAYLSAQKLLEESEITAPLMRWSRNAILARESG